MRNVFYDIETTGLGKGTGRIAFKKPVGIFNLAFAGAGGGVSSLYGISDVPWEDNEFIDNLRTLNKEGIDRATKAGRTEKQILKKFVGSLEEGDRLIGWNNMEFDSPVLLKRLKDLGLNEEATKVSQMEHIDLMRKVKGHMDRLLGEIPGAESSPWKFGTDAIPKGMTQEAIAAGLGIEVKAAHMGGDDARVLEEIAEYAEDYEIFKERFLSNNGLTEWARYVDNQRKGDSRQYTKYEDVFVGKTGAEPSGPLVRKIAESSKPSYYTRVGSDLMELNWSETPKEAVEDMAKTIAEGAKKTIKEPGKVAQNFEKYFGGLNDMDMVKSSKILGGIVAGGYAIKKIREFTRDKGNEVPEDLRINARELGKPTYEIINDLKRTGSVKNLNKEIQATYQSMKAGTMIGAQVAEDMSGMDGFIGSEVELEDRHLGVKGFADIVFRVGTEKRPIEVKTVDDEELDSLRGPKATHAMQANFYSHVLGAKMGHVMYVSREDPERRVTFDVPYDPGSLIAAVEKYRGALHSVTQSGGHKTALEYFFGNKSGTRDQTSRNYFTGPGYMRTPNPPNNSYAGSRNIPRNN